ncbi:aldo/keto reductase [candidate division KSB1 bacterium]|nr:aldo/keto reductase [candidate division KSB1 bacterium]
MKTIPLGQTGLKVSALCLGTMYFGSRIDLDTSFKLLDTYTERGGAFLDTANIYATWIYGCRGGESENLLGKWIKKRGNRKDLFIATKMGFEMPGVKRGLRAAQIEAECHKSLKRLGVETIDLYYAHKDDPHTPMQETLEAFDRLVKTGCVRHIGASNFPAWRMEEARWTSIVNNLSSYCCIQQRYSYLRPKPGAGFEPQLAANTELLDYCRMRDLTLLAYTPLLSGSYSRNDRPLSGKYVGPDSKARLRALRSVAGESGATPNQVVLAWMLQHDPPVLPVFGASTPDQMSENLAALDISLTTQQMERLNRAQG